MKHIKKVGIFYNIGKNEPRKIITNIELWLKRKKIQYFVFNEWPKSIPKINLAISIGGDGTILKLGRYLAGSSIPILGINLGRLGFLAEVNKKDLNTALDEVVAKNHFITKKRTLLDISIKRNSKTLFKHLAVNDVVISNKARVIDFDIFVGSEKVSRYTGDGIIISTPIGSTAYSLAAGGPIVYPDLPVCVITAICPHTLALRPLIVSDNKKITVCNFERHQDISLSVDGQIWQKLFYNDEVIVKKSKKNLNLIFLESTNYFEVLREKLGWGTR